MKTKDKRELHTKTEDELKTVLKTAREDLDKLKIENFQKKLKNTSSLNSKRKEIAQILTILKEKEFERSAV
jgi:ribosomal protein L29